MNIRQMVIGTLVGGIVLYALGMAFWGILFAEFIASNSGTATGINRNPQILWSSILATLIYAAFITHAISAKEVSASVVGGLRTGALVGFLVWSIANFFDYGLYNIYTLTGHITDTILETIRAGLSGAVIAFVVGKLSS